MCSIYDKEMSVVKIKSGYILREVAENNVVIPVGEETVNFNGIMTLNDSGAFLWSILSARDVDEKELVDAMLEEYEIDEKTASEDIKDFIATISEKGFLE